MLILRRPPADAPAPTEAMLIAPEPDEERELAAALNDVARLHAEHAQLNAAHDAYAQAYADESRRVAELLRQVQELRAAAASAPSARRKSWRLLG